MTDRMLAAIENPYTQIIAHPTGRLSSAATVRLRHGEDPRRLRQTRRRHGVQCLSRPSGSARCLPAHGKERGVKIVISTDSHTAARICPTCDTA